jgi:hypothetical protein
VNARITIERLKGGFIISYELRDPPDVLCAANREISATKRDLCDRILEFLDDLDNAELLRPYNEQEQAPVEGRVA